MIIRVRSSLGIWKLNVAEEDPTVLTIKKEIERQQQIPVDQQVLVFRDDVLEDNKHVTSLHLSRDDILELDGRIEREIISKAYIDDDGVLVPAGSKRVKVIPSGKFPTSGSAEAAANENQAEPQTATVAADTKEMGKITSSTPSPAPVLNSAIDSKRTTPSISDPMELDNINDKFNYADFDFEDSPRKTDQAKFAEEESVRSPIESRKMVLVDDEEEDSGGLYDNHSLYLNDMVGSRRPAFVSARQQHEQNLNEIARKSINKELQYGEIDESMVKELRAAGLSEAEIFAQIQQQKAVDAASRPPKPYAKRLTGTQQRALDRQRSEVGSSGPRVLLNSGPRAVDLHYDEIDESIVQELRAAGLSEAEIFAQIRQQKLADAVGSPPNSDAKPVPSSQQRALDRQRSGAADGTDGRRVSSQADTKDIVPDAQVRQKNSNPRASLSSSSSGKGPDRLKNNNSPASLSSSSSAKGFTLDAEYQKQKPDLQRRRDRIGASKDSQSSSSSPGAAVSVQKASAKAVGKELSVHGTSAAPRRELGATAKEAASLSSSSGYSYRAEALPFAREYIGRGSRTDRKEAKSFREATAVTPDDDMYTLPRPVARQSNVGLPAVAPQGRVAAYEDHQFGYDDDDEALNMALQLSLSEQAALPEQADHAELSYKVEEPDDNNDKNKNDPANRGPFSVDGDDDLEEEIVPGERLEHDDELAAQMLAFEELENPVSSTHGINSSLGGFGEFDRMEEEMQRHMYNLRRQAGPFFDALAAPRFGPSFEHFGDMLPRVAVAAPPIAARIPLQRLDQTQIEVDDEDEAFARALQNSLTDQ